MPRAIHDHPPSWNRTTTMTPISVPVAKQPSMQLHIADEKPPVYHLHAHDHDEAASQWSLSPRHAGHAHCHNGRLRGILFPALIALVVLSGLVALFCLFGDNIASTDPTEIIEGLFHTKRALDGGSGSGSGSSGSSFTNRKLYLIVIFVGLFVVVILGIMLSAWCCKGSFENPLCCPCYLCACCGGLACLECIGCGLCADGVEQM
ncbi:hypothetical protein MSAN_02047200 [Mycena sanguinolenta]|uniref:Transmembrane protein n=1 Tax=Mycena sanguinolenta TaxID=230812 RepID=A0A8H6XI19_9AGAR|nr:hypothetical protein MSAN_02047200 [Mycena sanguinolenta]